MQLRKKHRNMDATGDGTSYDPVQYFCLATRSYNCRERKSSVSTNRGQCTSTVVSTD